MAENFYTILTATGKAKLANSTVLGSKVNFKTLKVGDGKGSYYEPEENQTSLVNQVWSGNIGSISVDENNLNWIVIETLIPATIGGFFIREAGIFDEDDDLIAISKLSETYKPVVSEGSTKDLCIKIILEVSNAESVTLKIDPTVIVATKKDIQVVEAEVKGINAQLSDMMYQVSGGTGTAITLTIKGTLATGYPITFIASANNGGAATTINGKKLYKPATTNAPTLIKDKAYTVWYNASGDNGNGCFFIKASAEGDADVSNVLAGKKFSNDNDTGLVGTIPSKESATYTPGTTDQVITANQYLSGAQTIKGDSDLVGANIKKGINLFNIDGTYDPLTLIAGNAVTIFATASSPNGYYRTSYTAEPNQKATIMNSGGVVRIKFFLYSMTSGGTWVYSRIYINGIARGIERGTGSNSAILYTEDFTVNAGDLVQIYSKSDSNTLVCAGGLTLTCGNSYGSAM